MKKSRMIGMGTMAMIMPLAFGEVIYRNDFATRESVAPVPAYGVAYPAQPYPQVASGSHIQLCRNPGSAARASRDVFYSASVGNGRPNYDGWYVPFFDTNSKLVAQMTNHEGDNCFVWHSDTSTADRWGYVLHDIHNTFTNGTLRMQFDMKPPTAWETGYRSYVRLCPVFDKYMDILAWNGAYIWGGNFNDPSAPKLNPGEVGLININSSTGDRSLTYLNSVDKIQRESQGLRINSMTTDKWIRYVVTYYLDTSKYDISAYQFDADVAHPTFDTATPASPYTTRNGSAFSTAISASTGGISGIAIHSRSRGFTGTGLDNKVLVDNIRLSWRAPGSDDFEVVYENDFRDRWYKTVCAKNRGTTSSGYAPKTMLVDVDPTSTIIMEAFAGTNMATNNIVPAVSSDASAAQPEGLDGWRRLPYMDGNNAYCAIRATTGSGLDTGEGTNVLVVGSSATAAPATLLVANKIGETYTSGKVRLSVDVRLPTGGDAYPVNYVADVLRAAVGLGSTALYSSPRAFLAANVVAGFGYKRTKDGAAEKHVPYVLGPSDGGNVQYLLEATYKEPTVPYLYRMEIAADIDSRTYDVMVTPLSYNTVDSSFTPTGDAIYAKSGIPFASSAADIGSFYLYGFGIRATESLNLVLKSRVNFDNIRIWRQATGAASETLVYFNDFKTRIRASSGETPSVARATGYLAEQYDLDDGPDHWIRRSVTGDAGCWATATVRDDGGNQFLALGREKESGMRIQVANTFGASVTRPFKLFVDVRPPAGWRADGGFALVSAGSMKMNQMQTAEPEFNAHRQMAFGFCDVAGTAYSPWFRTGMQPVAYADVNGTETPVSICDASAILNDHWYRFKATVYPADGVYAVSIYDMGTAHPTETTAPVACVGRASAIKFLNDLGAGDGIAAFNIHAYGMGGVAGEAGVDADNVLIDNVRAEYLSGTFITFR